jgi:integrase
MTIPATADVRRALDAAQGSFPAFVGLGAFAVLRLGEASGVQLGDIDFVRRTLSVSRQVQRDAGSLEVRPPKYGSERTIYLPHPSSTC